MEWSIIVKAQSPQLKRLFIIVHSDLAVASLRLPDTRL